MLGWKLWKAQEQDILLYSLIRTGYTLNDSFISFISNATSGVATI